MYLHNFLSNKIYLLPFLNNYYKKNNLIDQSILFHQYYWNKNKNIFI